MRRTSILFNLLGAVGLFGLLSGCGSGGGGASTSTSGTASESAESSGTVTGFGSVIVNGKEFDTSGASFTVDGLPGIQDDLKLGMTVMVIGSVNGDQWSANVVSQKDAVEGLVQSIAANGLSLVVMGQTVVVDSATLIDNSLAPNSLKGDIHNLLAGDSVEVNGHIKPNGEIQATFIEKKLIGVTPEVRGFVSGHDLNKKTFKIGNLTVDYNAVLPVTMPSQTDNGLDGIFVEVKGTLFTPGPNVLTEGTLVATKVELENQDLGNIGNNIDEFEVEGFVTKGERGDFFIGTTHVLTTERTEFLGRTIDKIIVGAKISADGTLKNGTLTAKHVIFHATEARAVTIGFDGMPLGPFSSGSEAGFNIGPSTGGTWSIEASGINHFLSSNQSPSNFQVELPSSGIGNNRKPIFPEFTVQGLDVSSSGGQTTFTIVGLHGVNLEVFHLTYTTSSDTFQRISIANEALNPTNGTFAFQNLVDNTNRPFDVNVDKVERLVISASHDIGITSRVDCIHVGAGSNNCISGGAPTGNVP